MNSSQQLCLSCGMCCDGTLFDNVQLGPGDDPEGLKALGLPVRLSRAKNPAASFRQPCAALCSDRSCRIYADRPGHCRGFECAVLKDLQAGRSTLADAQLLVKKVQRKAEKIRRLLRELGETDERRSFNDRFSRAQRRLESGGGDEAAGNLFADLSQALFQLNRLAYKKFLAADDHES